MVSIIGNLNTADAFTEIQFPDGRILRLPTAMLEAERAVEGAKGSSTSGQGTMIVPVIEEQLEITKRTVDTGKVSLETTVETFDVTIDEPLAVTSWNVERVAFGHVVQTVPPVREEELTTIYPVLEERLVWAKELILVEEIRVTRESSERRVPQIVTLRREHIDIQRKNLGGS